MVPQGRRAGAPRGAGLGALFAAGQGVPKDFPEAAKWYRKAADQGDPSAQFNLGLMYADGEGVAARDAEAARWFRNAAEQGDAVAQFNLGLRYGDGLGLPQDNVQAWIWLSLATLRAGEAEAQKAFAQARDIVASRMTAAQLEEARRRAAGWQPKSWQMLQPKVP